MPTPLLLKLLACFGLTMLMLWLLNPVAKKFNWLDHPGEHKTHNHKTPLTGGFAIYIAIYIVVLFSASNPQAYAVLNYTALALLIFGLMDDTWFLSARSRIIAETCCLLVMIFLGEVALHNLGKLMWDGVLGLGWLWAPITVFSALGVINAFNMIDGLDGLAGSIFLIAAGGMAFLALRAGNIQSYEILMLAFAAVTGYLLLNARFPWNRKARAFLGDSGSGLLGLFLAWQFIELGNGQSRAYAPITAVWLFAVPLLDTSYLITKRLREGLSPFAADQRHLHHAFLRAGLGITQTWLIITALAVVMAAFGLYTELQQWPQYWRFYIFISLSLAYYSLMNRAWKDRRFLGREFIPQSDAYGSGDPG